MKYSYFSFVYSYCSSLDYYDGIWIECIWEFGNFDLDFILCDHRKNTHSHSGQHFRNITSSMSHTNDPKGQKRKREQTQNIPN